MDAKQHRKSLLYDKVPNFLVALRASSAGDATTLALGLVILTALRSGEVLLAQRPEFDLDQGIWTRPALRMKSKKEHRIRLSPRALELLSKEWALRSGRGMFFRAPFMASQFRTFTDTTQSNAQQVL